MREFIAKLLDEENRQADIVAFGQIVSLAIAVLVTLILLIPAAISVAKTGKIDSNAVWIITVWLGSAATFGVADSRRATAPSPPQTAPVAPAVPQPPIQPSPPKVESLPPSQSSSSPSPKPADPPTQQRNAL